MIQSLKYLKRQYDSRLRVRMKRLADEISFRVAGLLPINQWFFGGDGGSLGSYSPREKGR